MSGWHTPGLFAPFPAAITAGIVLGLNSGQLYQALGIAGSQASGLMAAQFGSMVKRMLTARGAQSGVSAALLAAATGAGNRAMAQAGLNFGSSNQPVEIFADQGIEWHQDSSAYVARGNARAVRGDTTVYAQTLTAYYRKSSGNPSASGTVGDSQIYRVDADGAVRIVSPSGTAYGDHAVYDVDKGILVPGTHP